MARDDYWKGMPYSKKHTTTVKKPKSLKVDKYPKYEEIEVKKRTPKESAEEWMKTP